MLFASFYSPFVCIPFHRDVYTVLSLSFSSSARERIYTWVFAYISFFFFCKTIPCIFLHGVRHSAETFTLDEYFLGFWIIHERIFKSEFFPRQIEYVPYTPPRVSIIYFNPRSINHITPVWVATFFFSLYTLKPS